MALGRVADGAPAPGIWAHGHFQHADGAWPALYAWLRTEAGLPPCTAYEEAVRLAADAKQWADVAVHAGIGPA